MTVLLPKHPSLAFFGSLLFLLHGLQTSYSQPRPPHFTGPLNPRLETAFFALQALKHSITSDPKHVTANWDGPHVCNYTGVFCAPAPDDKLIYTVAGLDLNHANLSGTLPPDLGLLSDLALFHLNSNHFCGTLPHSFRNLHLLYELDVSSNRLDGPFPSVVLHLPSLHYLDIRYNNFYGKVPAQVFSLKIDALFLNNNNFTFSLPDTIANSTASVMVFANTGLSGCLPSGIGQMWRTLNELVLINTNITGCLPPEIGKLNKLTVFDVSFNNIVGELPATLGGMEKLEQLDVAHNELYGEIPEAICELPRLKNFTYSYNYFCDEPESCLKIKRVDDRRNCIPWRPKQREEQQCEAFLSKPVHCQDYGCFAAQPPPPPPPPHY